MGSLVIPRVARGDGVHAPALRTYSSLLRTVVRVFAIVSCCAAIGAAAAFGLSAGDDHVVAVRSDGSVVSWGADSYGQLGRGQLLKSPVPLRINGLASVVAVAESHGQALALTREGRLYTWGQYWAGEPRDSVGSGRPVPEPVPGIDGVTAIATGDGFAVVLRGDGTVWSWGGNYHGQLGLGHEGGTVAAPTRIPSLSGIVAIAAGQEHVLAVGQDGSVWAWGYNGDGGSGISGALGDGSSVLRRSAPVRVAGMENAIAVAAGIRFSLALRRDGTVWAWGLSGVGQCGVIATSRPVPAPVAGLSGIVRVASGRSHSVALRSDGSVLTWGSNQWGQLGAGFGFLSRATPAVVAGASAVVAVAAGADHSLVLDGSGRPFAFGLNNEGQLGIGNEAYSAMPLAVSGLAGVAALAAGNRTSYAVLGDGSVRAWGSNRVSQLGVAFLANSSVPTPVILIDDVVSVAAGGAYSLAVRRDGTVWGWGRNDGGQLADATLSDRSSPVRVRGLVRAVAVAASSSVGYLSAALLSDGTVWHWGWTTRSRNPPFAGTPQPAGSLDPVRVAGLSDIVSIALGFRHGLALARNGAVWSWGVNYAGQLGTGGTSTQFEGTGRQVPGLSGIVAIGAAANESYALAADGRVYAWGEGVLGEGGHSERHSPVALTTIAGVSALHAGGSLMPSKIAELRDGTVRAWGGNNFRGALGDGSNGERLTPTPIPGISSLAAAAPSSEFTVVALQGGATLGSGYNVSGMLGDGTYANRYRHAAVLGVGGTGVLDLSPEDPPLAPENRLPVFEVRAAGDVNDAIPTITGDIRFRPADAGTSGSVYVFAVAPADAVAATTGSGEPTTVGEARSRDGGKADAVPCVLAQLNASGQLAALSASSLQAYVTGVLSAQGQSVTILSGVPAAAIAGATFYVGYGASGQAMLDAGVNRSAVSVPGTRECKPQAPQTGWWWNPAEGGRGFSIETSGNRLFMAAYLYDVSGRATWLVSGGPTSLDGSLYTGRLLSVANGQTLAGAYRKPAPITDEGAVTMAFTDATRGTLVWPGGSIPIERFNIVPGGLAAQPQPNQPENGWWWNAAEDGRGFFIEWQNGWADLAGYMYDDAGNPVWYISVFPTPEARSFSGSWWEYGNGQTLTGSYRPATRVNENVAPVTVQFSGPDTAILTLPGGRPLALTRYRF